MGVEREIRVTAYLKFPFPKKSEEQVMHIACCNKQQNAKFCQLCGSAIQTRTYTVQVNAIDHYTVAQEIKDALCYLSDDLGGLDDDYDVWFPNDVGAVNDEEAGHHEITEEMITAEKTKIVRLYADQIDVLAKHYGSRPHVCFGMLVWEG